jgi:hypothetical protein
MIMLRPLYLYRLHLDIYWACPVGHGSMMYLD